jgi:hypothetical protein
MSALQELNFRLFSNLSKINSPVSETSSPGGYKFCISASSKVERERERERANVMFYHYDIEKGTSLGKKKMAESWKLGRLDHLLCSNGS